MTDNSDSIEPMDDDVWATVADRLDETMRQRLLDFGKGII